ncbi:polysaccharide pyruvyl transferase family protein [Chelatococcus sambhunathii]|uniref:Polysaccharide pyruvyl transferase family protein n=1 Tax=Chelatococcus sambhunathii TaxID=363953 RepID=A0ABU1DAM6_9HYPH|nr:polysaccharide pyruvyl transferase family protein [Chelatococcus sambhunathii]
MLNPDLIHRLSGSPVAHADDVLGWNDRPVFRVVGSSLANCRPNDVVWGMGLIDQTTSPEMFPAQICAVRGPKSRARMLAMGRQCPEIYGDPAVLYPALYLPKIEKQHRIGIIQHFREIDVVPLPKIADVDDPLNIDIRSGLRNVVNDILSCDRIVSSSLHGVICAHSYGVPAIWYQASDLLLGDGLKFHDYFASIGHDNISPARVGEDGVLDAGYCPDRPSQSRIDYVALIDACPFMSLDRKRDLVRRIARQAEQGVAGTIYGAFG